MQKVNPYEVLHTDKPVPPLVIKLSTPRNAVHMEGGTFSSSQKVEEYVLFSALPEELKQRVRVALQAVQAQF